jgi:3-deoxy-D-manno-octulosonic acid kinase
MGLGMGKSTRWPTGAEVRQKPISGGAMLYDASRAGNAEASWFDPKWWSARGRVRPGTEGRGGVSFIDADGQQLVLRHYHRGGWIAPLAVDAYLWRGEALTRSFVEWHMLYLMRRAGLPVPLPIAASYRRSGRYGYRADLLTEQIPGTESLATLLRAGSMPLSRWIALGRCLRRFHEDGVFHADLNAHNVLLGEGAEVWLVDFDRGRLRKPGLWCDVNLVRLRRSVEKITARLPVEHFSDADWDSLLRGYFAHPAVAPAA